MKHVASLPGLCVLLLIAFTGSAAFGAKTDTVLLKNGDVVTCEIKQLERGQLKVSTDSMGTVYIEWVDVQRLASPARFVVELADGRRLSGALTETLAHRKLTVDGRGGTESVLLQNVVRIDQLNLDESRLKRWDGSVSVGIDFAKTNAQRNVNGAFDLHRRGKDFMLGMDGSLYLQSQDGLPDSTRADLQAEYLGLMQERWYWTALGALERNDELGIDLRTLLGGGYGRFLRQTTRSLWSATGGLAVVNEQRAGNEAAETNIEAIIDTRFEYFTYKTPKTSLTTSLTLFPSITDAGRLRSSLDFSLRRELIEDLFLSLTVYGSQDNQSPDESESTDYGLITSVGYSF